MNTTKVIIFNAPPDCGKDFLSDYLVADMGAKKNEFKATLRKLVMYIYGIEEELYWAIYNNRILKEMPLKLFGGKSMRDLHIEVSEDVIKPFYGKSYFGDRAADLLTLGEVNVFADGGFVEELLPVVHKVGHANVLIVRLRGEGSFAGDSRGYLPSASCVGVKFVDINYTKDAAGLGKVLSVVNEFLGTKELTETQ